MGVYYVYLIVDELLSLREKRRVMARKSHDTDPYSLRIRANPEVSCSMKRTCTPRVRNRIFPDSDFFRGKENPISGHLLETRRVKARKLSYSSRFTTNNAVPQASPTTDQVEHFYCHPVLLIGF